MLFNSVTFAVFVPIVFVLYWFAVGGCRRLQNILIVAASYVFYGWWDWRFLSLVAISTLINYAAALGIGASQSELGRKRWLGVSIVTSLALLGFFKYLGFFVQSWVAAWSALGVHMDTASIRIVLPVGISFYTFQTMSYTIDVYRRRLEPTRDIVAFSAFVMFFPQLVAGPIERATNLLPQFFRERHFDYAHAVQGLRQMLWGLLKKTVIADNCAVYANQAFSSSGCLSGWDLVLGVVYFAFQIYGDFSGYSDIAVGCAKLFGFDLMTNFRYPYFSRDIAEFWRRWHISLSTWFRDYVYIPLGGARGTLNARVRNVLVVFVVSGFWHGANWTFIVWGALNALFFMPLLITNRNRRNLGDVAEGRLLPSAADTLRVAGTFSLVCVAWVFFRADSLHAAVCYLGRIAKGPLLAAPTNLSMPIAGAVALLLLAEWLGRTRDCPLDIVCALPSRGLRWPAYSALIVLILSWGRNEQPFIYFQF